MLLNLGKILNYFTLPLSIIAGLGIAIGTKLFYMLPQAKEMLNRQLGMEISIQQQSEKYARMVAEKETEELENALAHPCRQ